MRYNRLLNQCKQSNLYTPIHQKNNLVKDVKEDDNILNAILNYRLFINENHFDLKLVFDQLNLNSEVNSRVKSRNSIEYKISNYMTEKHEFGKVPLN